MKRAFLILLTFFLAEKTHCQEINLFIKDIKEERHLDENDSFIEFETLVKGIKVDEFNQIKVTKITQAEDDKGRVLKKKESFFGDDYSSDNKLKIKIEAPSRSSTKIKSLKGIIKYFSPSISNNSKIVFENIRKYFNKNLLKKKHPSVKLTLIDKEALEKLKKEDEKKYQKELEKLKKQGEIGDGLAEVANVFKDLFEGFSNFGNSDESLSFYVDDKNDEIVEILVFNDKGEKINYGSSRYGSNRLTISLKEKITDKSRIEVLVENDKAVKEYNFELNNIILP